MSQGVRISQPTVWDGNNRGKIKGILPAQWFLVLFVDLQGKESKGYALFAEGRWYVPRNGSEMHSLDTHLTSPSTWFAKELGRVSSKLALTKAKQEKVAIPQDDVGEVD